MTSSIRTCLATPIFTAIGWHLALEEDRRKARRQVIARSALELDRVDGLSLHRPADEVEVRLAPFSVDVLVTGDGPI